MRKRTEDRLEEKMGGGRGEQKIGMERGYWERRKGKEDIGERRREGKEEYSIIYNSI